MKSKFLYRILCVSFAAVSLTSLLTSCRSKTDDTATSVTVSTTTSAPNIEGELNGLKTNTQKGCSYDGKYYAKREKVKGEEGLYVLTVYLAEDDSRVIELHPSNQKFTKFSWLDDQYKIYVYTGDTVVDAFYLNGTEWRKANV